MLSLTRARLFTACPWSALATGGTVGWLPMQFGQLSSSDPAE
jgi:hypothetical protein